MLERLTRCLANDSISTLARWAKLNTDSQGKPGGAGGVLSKGKGHWCFLKAMKLP